MKTGSKAKRPAKKTAAGAPRKRSTAGASIVKGLEQAIAWTRGESENVRVTLVHVPHAFAGDGGNCDNVD
ncbi:MAG TPA: hypothetical protein VMU19_00415 [Bryobacteraceae bacterium]|nr:hypothetical protein [Bryobacteraceae bacterium]